MRYILIFILFTLSSCSTLLPYTTISYKNIESKEYGMVLYRIFTPNYENATLDFGLPVTTVGSFKKMQYDDYPATEDDSNGKNVIKLMQKYCGDSSLDHPELLKCFLKKTKDLEKKDHNLLYKLEYLKPGIYPIKLRMSEEDSIGRLISKNTTLKSCVKIKPGVVNYIGDFYWGIGKTKMISPLHTLFLHQETFDSKVSFQDNQNNAKAVISKKYPKLLKKVPFVVSKLSLENCGVDN